MGEHRHILPFVHEFVKDHGPLPRVSQSVRQLLDNRISVERGISIGWFFPILSDLSLLSTVSGPSSLAKELEDKNGQCFVL